MNNQDSWTFYVNVLLKHLGHLSDGELDRIISACEVEYKERRDTTEREYFDNWRASYE